MTPDEKAPVLAGQGSSASAEIEGDSPLFIKYDPRGLDSGGDARQSCCWGRISRGESSTRSTLGWGGSIEIFCRGSAGESSSEHFLSVLHRKCLSLTVPVTGSEGTYNELGRDHQGHQRQRHHQRR